MSSQNCEVQMEDIANNHTQPVLKFTLRNERKILKAFLLSHLYQILCDLFHLKKQLNQSHSSMEYYAMDSKVIQLLIQNILDTDQYTLEGIAYYTRIPFDVIYDAACGISNQFSITPLARVVNLYLKVKPDVAQVLINKLIAVKNKNIDGLSSLLSET